MKRKIIFTTCGNLFTNIACAIAIFIATAPVNLKLMFNWLSRAAQAGSPNINVESQMAQLAELRASSSYAALLTNCHILVTAVILIAEVAIIAGLVWLALQNFRKLVWAICK